MYYQFDTIELNVNFDVQQTVKLKSLLFLEIFFDLFDQSLHFLNTLFVNRSSLELAFFKLENLILFNLEHITISFH